MADEKRDYEFVCLGLYRGFAISVAGIFVYRAFYFGGYDAGKRFMFGDNPNPSLLYRFLFAQFITSSSELLAYPLDTIRRYVFSNESKLIHIFFFFFFSRLMMQSGRGDIIYRGTMDCARKIALNEGLTAFFKGNLSNIYRSVGSSLVLVLYDEFKRYLVLTGQASYAK